MAADYKILKDCKMLRDCGELGFPERSAGEKVSNWKQQDSGPGQDFIKPVQADEIAASFLLTLR
jgi:hypothetical protein